ncbi:MAG: bifunctional riboflavin kinase/FAD synthetase [Dehalococcoidia bacterium]
MTTDLQLAHEAPPRETVLTIGVFDGVHLGHQKLLRQVQEVAARLGHLSCVLTFANHPRPIISPQLRVPLITTLQQRQELLKAQGLDLVLTVPFTWELSLLPARSFVSLLMEQLKMRTLVVGPDFALGHQRQGNVTTLRRLGQEMGFSLQEVEPLKLSSEVVSSSAIRQAIAQGDLERVARMLGRSFTLRGRVIPGVSRGQDLGFPTANLQMDPQQTLPRDGIYATWAHVGGQRWMAATNIGVRPTFSAGGERLVEAFILDFDGDLYRQELDLEFVRRLRDELPFPSPRELVEQMHRDVEQARAILSHPTARAR